MAEKLKAYTGEEPFIFVSYAHDDVNTVMPVLKDMEENRFRFWYDEGIMTGAKWAAVINEKITRCTQFVVFISQRSVLSENVKNEVHLAFKRGKQMVVAYLDETELEGDLEYYLDRLQAKHLAEEGSAEAFSRALLTVFSPKAMDKSNDVREARERLEQHYRLEERFAKRSYSETYRAVNLTTGLPVIVKHLTFDDTFLGQRRLKMAENEVAVLKHIDAVPLCQRLEDCYSDSRNYYIVKQYVYGETVAERMARDALTPAEAVDIAADISVIIKNFTGLKPKVVHADINPNNIVVGSDCASLIDFNISRMYDGEVSEPQKEAFGTKGYAPPEQYRNEVNWKSDVYSLGATLFYMLTGIQPSKAYRLSPRHFNPFVPAQLDAIVRKMTEEDSAFRYESPEELTADLQAVDVSEMKYAFRSPFGYTDAQTMPVLNNTPLPTTAAIPQEPGFHTGPIGGFTVPAVSAPEPRNTADNTVTTTLSGDTDRFTDADGDYSTCVLGVFE